jgi:uncharacterized phage protein gp47/JayE
MPFIRPTLSELRGQVSADIASAFPGADPLLRYSNLGVLGDVLAALANGHFGYLDWIAKQSVPFTADGEFLEAWAGLKAVLRKPATRAVGQASFPGTTGSVLTAGTPVIRSDGVAYTTTADAIASAGAVTAPIKADLAGASGNAPSGTAVTLGGGVSGITASGVIEGPVTGGADIEADDSLRSRMLAAYAAPPQGGAATDYVEWALAVPGVTRCWVAPAAMGPGTIVLYFMLDSSEEAHDGFPQGTNGVAAGETRGVTATGDQLALANAIFPRQPVTALVYAVAPQPNTINLTLAGLSGSSSATRSAIDAAVRSALLLTAAPGGVTNISSIEAAIASVAAPAGFVITSVTATAGIVSPGAAGNISSTRGRLPVLGVITYV